jgi:hypothetical protein
MSDTIADVIKNSSEKENLSEAVGSPFNSDASLYKQTQILLATDERDFQRLGANFLLPRYLYNSLDVGFNDFLAEPLLREGSLLLDRCLQQRREYQDLHTKWFEACVQVDEMFRLNEITKKEEDETYHLPGQIADTEAEALNYLKTSADESSKSLGLAIPEMGRLAAILQELGRLAAHAQAHGQFGETMFNQFGKNRLIKEFVHDYASEGEFIKGEKEKRLLGIQRNEQVRNSQSAESRWNGAKYSATLKKSQANFQKERNDVARLVAIRRAEQLTKPNGALNFFEQMKPIKIRFRNDLLSAWLRLKAVAVGLEKLYQYSAPFSFPELRPVNEEDLQKPELTDLPEPPPIDDFVGKFDFDDLITWCQLTNTWLASFLDIQQQVTRSFSLRQLIKNDAVFEAGKAQSEWRFKLKEEHFTNMQFVRMRSFAVQIDSGHQSGSWNVSITPPLKAKNEPKEQGHIGTLYLGRVNEKTFAVISEGSASLKLFNASPIGEDSPSGEWIIEVLNGSTSAATVNDIKDIDIHLTVAIV